MRRKRQKHKNFVLRLYTIGIVVALAVTCAYVFIKVDEVIVPALIEISDLKATNKVNQIMLDSLNRIVVNEDLDSSDFYDQSTDANGLVTLLSVNTLLVNDICARTAADISNEIDDLKSERIGVPLGAALGFDVLANTGPVVTATIMPVGNATCDYDTKFEGVGLNQVNFQVWLYIKAVIKVVNPLQESHIAVERKISLVNTVFNGRVPDYYLNYPKAP